LLIISGVAAAKFELERQEKRTANENKGRVTSIATSKNQNLNLKSLNPKQNQASDKTKNKTQDSLSKVQSSKTNNKAKQKKNKPQTHHFRPKVKPIDYVYLKINSGPAAGYYQIEYKKNENGYSFMQRAGKKYGFNLYSDYWQGLGYFIKCIGGLCGKGNSFWALYLNGNFSMVGISFITLNKNDTLEWRYETF